MQSMDNISEYDCFLILLGDEMCHYLYVRKSECVVDRIKIASLYASLGGDWI